MPIAKVHRISAAAPDDVSGIEAAIAAGRIDPKGVMAVLGKTEGNGLVNDFARGYAALALSLLFQRHLAGGAGGQDLPRDVRRHRRRHGAALDRVRARGRRGSQSARRWRSDGRTRRRCRPSISAGCRRSTWSRPRCARRWPTPASTDPADVHFVQVKCPLLTVQRVGEAESARRDGRDPRHAEIDGAVARRECARRRGGARRDRTRAPRATRRSEATGACGRAARAARPASSCSVTRSWCSACRRAWSGPLAIDHAVMADAIDIEPVRGALGRLGLADRRPAAASGAPAPGRGARQGRGEPRRPPARPSPHHAGRFRHFVDAPCPRLRLRRAGRAGRACGDLCLRRRRASGPGWRRAGRADRRSRRLNRRTWCRRSPMGPLTRRRVVPAGLT